MADGISQIIIKSPLEAVSKLSSQDVLSSAGEPGYYMLKKLIRRFHGRVDAGDSGAPVGKGKHLTGKTRRRRRRRRAY